MAGEELVWEVGCLFLGFFYLHLHQMEEGDEMAPGLEATSVKLQLSYFSSSVTSERGTEQEAVAGAARSMLQEQGPWVLQEELDQVNILLTCFSMVLLHSLQIVCILIYILQVTTSIKAALPMSRMSWLPPLYNITHVPTFDPSTGASSLPSFPPSVARSPLGGGGAGQESLQGHARAGAHHCAGEQY